MLGDAAVVEAVLRDPQTAPVSDADRALYRLVVQAARAAASITEREIGAARSAGWSDEALYDALTVVALFRFYNTWCDASGVHAMPADAHALSGKRISEKGYAW